MPPMQYTPPLKIDHFRHFISCHSRYYALECFLSHIEYIYLRLPSKETRIFFLTKLFFSRTPSRPWAPGTHLDEISKQTIGKYLPIIVCGKLSDEGGWGIGRSDQEWAGKVGRFQAAGKLGAGEGLEFRWMSSLLRLFKYHWVHLQFTHF